MIMYLDVEDFFGIINILLMVRNLKFEIVVVVLMIDVMLCFWILLENVVFLLLDMDVK